MRGCISTSKVQPSPALSISSRWRTVLVLTLLCLMPASHALAAAGDSRTQTPEEDDYGDTPFTRYGEFNDEEEEAADTAFFQYGRLFGVSLGAGFEGVSGNRGALYQGGFPQVELKVHYWFDFNFGLDLTVSTVQHTYEIKDPTTPQSLVGRYKAVINRLGLDMKYYFDTKDLSAPISFANPYIFAGFGAFSKSETSTASSSDADIDSKLGFTAGAGLEFTIKPKKSYFYIEGKAHAVQFEDTTSDVLAGTTSSPHLADRTGFFYAFSAGVLFTW